MTRFDASASAAATARMAATLLVALLLPAFSECAAANAPVPKPFVRESLQQMTATVVQVSLATRELTLRGSSGKTRTIKVGPEARNLDKVRVGDRVNLSYYESFTAQMRLHDKPNVGFMSAAGEVRAAPGERPGGGAAQSRASTVTIDSVDTQNNSVSFHRADGGTSTLPVKSAEGREFIAHLKRGDVVDVMYTEAVAIDVAPAPASAK